MSVVGRRRPCNCLVFLGRELRFRLCGLLLPFPETAITNDRRDRTERSCAGADAALGNRSRCESYYGAIRASRDCILACALCIRRGSQWRFAFLWRATSRPALLTERFVPDLGHYSLPTALLGRPRGIRAASVSRRQPRRGCGGGSTAFRFGAGNRVARSAIRRTTSSALKERAGPTPSRDSMHPPCRLVRAPVGPTP